MSSLARWVSALLVLGFSLHLPLAAADDEVAYSRAELDQMLAPIALYPDSVLSHVLIASTYPLEIVQAARWSRQHPDLHGQEAVEAVEDQPWDASVKALAAFPELLARMDDDLDWTERLGDAFLAQQEEVMDAVQGLRERAYDAGTLDSLEHARVVREREVIYIEPVHSHLVYVPWYDPWVVYGPWWWPAYHPHHWTHWHGRPAHRDHGTFYWGIGFHVAPTFYFTGFHWHDRYVVVRPAHRHPPRGWAHSAREAITRGDAQRWQHNPSHRRGVAYRSEAPRREFGSERRHAIERERGLDPRPSTRGRDSARRENGRADRAPPRSERTRAESNSREAAWAERGWQSRSAERDSRQARRDEGRASRAAPAPRAWRSHREVEAAERPVPRADAHPRSSPQREPRHGHESRGAERGFSQPRGEARGHDRPPSEARGQAEGERERRPRPSRSRRET